MEDEFSVAEEMSRMNVVRNSQVERLCHAILYIIYYIYKTVSRHIIIGSQTISSRMSEKWNLSVKSEQITRELSSLSDVIQKT